MRGAWRMGGFAEVTEVALFRVLRASAKWGTALWPLWVAGCEAPRRSWRTRWLPMAVAPAPPLAFASSVLAACREGFGALGSGLWQALCGRVHPGSGRGWPFFGRPPCARLPCEVTGLWRKVVWRQVLGFRPVQA